MRNLDGEVLRLISFLVPIPCQIWFMGQNFIYWETEYFKCLMFAHKPIKSFLLFDLVFYTYFLIFHWVFLLYVFYPSEFSIVYYCGTLLDFFTSKCYRFWFFKYISICIVKLRIAMLNLPLGIHLRFIEPLQAVLV